MDTACLGGVGSISFGVGLVLFRLRLGMEVRV